MASRFAAFAADLERWTDPEEQDACSVYALHHLAADTILFCRMLIHEKGRMALGRKRECSKRRAESGVPEDRGSITMRSHGRAQIL